MEDSGRRKRRRIKNSNRRNIRQRLNYDPQNSKKKPKRELRLEIKRKQLMKDFSPSEQPATLKFGSFNVRGLDLETAWVVQDLLHHRKFDVSWEYTMGVYYAKMSLPSKSRKVILTRPLVAHRIS